MRDATGKQEAHRSRGTAVMRWLAAVTALALGWTLVTAPSQAAPMAESGDGGATTAAPTAVPQSLSLRRNNISVSSHRFPGWAVVDVDPNLPGTKSYVVVLKKWNGSRWRTVKKYRTAGSAEKRTMKHLAAGNRYKILVPRQHGMGKRWGPTWTHDPGKVSIDHQTYPVSNSGTSTEIDKGMKLKVDLGPDLPGKRSYTFDVFRKDASGKWIRYRSLRTARTSETKALMVPYGKYKVRVRPQHGMAANNVYPSRQGPAQTWLKSGNIPTFLPIACSTNPDTVNYYVNPMGQTNRLSDIQAGVERFARFSGVNFVYQGLTGATELNNALVITVDTKENFGGSAGLGWFKVATSGSSLSYYRLGVQINPDYNRSLTASRFRALITHEVAHTFGANHSDRRTDLLYPSLTSDNSSLSIWDMEKSERAPAQACPLR